MTKSTFHYSVATLRPPPGGEPQKRFSVSPENISQCHSKNNVDVMKNLPTRSNNKPVGLDQSPYCLMNTLARRHFSGDRNVTRTVMCLRSIT